MFRNVKYPGSCLECRKRRLKCDETKPYCFKCQKNGRPCSGYTDWSQLAVRDQTALTINRFRTSEGNPRTKQGRSKTPSSMALSLPSRSSARQVTSSGQSDRPAAVIAMTPVPSIDQQAMAFLHVEFIGQEPLTLDPGYSHLLQLISRLDCVSDCLSACLSAAALAAFSCRPNAKTVETKAHKAYASALSAVNIAIQKSNAADDDQLLASVLLLAFYESFRSNQLIGFYNHIFGAASMIKARKTKVVVDGFTTQLYLVVRYEVYRTSLLGFANPEDADLGLWWRWRNNISCATYTPNILTEVDKIDVSNLDYHVRSMMDFVVAKNPILEVVNQQGFPQDLQSAQNLIEVAVSYIKTIVDRFTEMETIAFVCQGSKPLRVPCPTQRDPIFPDAYPQTPICIYKNMHHAVFHLCICLARVSCLTHLVSLISQINFTTGHEEMPGYQMMVTRAHDDLETIVSSIPYVCGWTADGTHIFPDASNSHSQARNTCFAPNFIIWALIGPATNHLATRDQKAYLIHMAQYVAQVRRIRQAEALLDVTVQATTRNSMSRWHHTVLSGENERIPASWIGKGTSLEDEIYRQNHAEQELRR